MRARPGPAPRRRGFTLIEVLVAVSIMAIMALMSWRGVEGIVRTQAAAEARLTQTYTLNTALAQWAADLVAVQETPWVPALAFDGNTLRMTRETPQGMQVVAWTLIDGHWRRWSAPPTTRRGELQEWWMRAMTLVRSADDPRVEQIDAVSGVRQWQVYYFRDSAWTNPQSSDARGTQPDPAGAADAPPDGASGNDPAPVNVVQGRINNPARGLRLGAARTAASVPEGVRIVLTLGPTEATAAAPSSVPALSGIVTRDFVLRRGGGR